MSSTKQQQQQKVEDLAEDKKCRICGYADTRNINIYSPRHCKQLVTKILAVYPIVLYENDPLPKNICRKCINNVSMMYNDILRVMKIQVKWINNVRTVQPRHKYIRVLDEIENTNSVTRESIKATLGEDINEVNVSRLLFAKNQEIMTPEIRKITKPKTNSPEDKPTTKSTLMSFSMDYDDGVTRKDTCSENENADLIANTSPSTQMKDIKSILEQNGCSLLHLNTTKSTQNKVTSKSLEQLDYAVSSKKIKTEEELIEDDNTNILDSILATPATKEPPPGPPPPLTVKCRLCPLQFNSLELLATHQIIHMRLCVPKIFQKRYLHKRVRRGRLISVQDRKCIRCLNCWRVFVDNKSILEHWAMGECDFYCHICGKEFAQAPKMLREHVPAAHGISYRSSKIHRARLSTKILMSMSQTPDENPDYKLYQAVSEQEPLPFEEIGGRTELTQGKAKQKKASPVAAKNAAKTSKSSITPTKKSATKAPPNNDANVTCNICQKTFQNFKARNSHMRKHKPVYAYGDVVLPPHKGVRVANNVKDESEDYAEHKDDEHTFNATQPATLSNANSLMNANESCFNAASGATLPNTNTLPTASNSNSGNIPPVRGVRTKFVALRSDPNAVTGNVATSTTTLKVKPLNELQNPTPTTSAASLSAPWTLNPLPAPTNVAPTTTVIASKCIEIKSEPIDPDTEYTESRAHYPPQPEKTFSCIACKNRYATKIELFQHRRRCRVNYLFKCNYCPETLGNSADFYVHMIQLHKPNSN